MTKNCVAALSMLLLLFHPTFAMAEDPQKALQGEWVAEQIQHAGMKLPAKALAGIYTFKGGVLTTALTLRQGRVTERYTVKLDTTKSPWTFDQTRSDGRFKGKVYLGIYKVEKGKVTLCVDARAQNKRPSDFVSSQSNGRLLVVLTKKGAKEQSEPKDAKDEAKKEKPKGSAATLRKEDLEGTWRLIKSNANGVESSKAEIEKRAMTMTIQGSKCVWKTSRRKTNGHTETVYTMTLDLKKDPAHIDLMQVKRRAPMEGIIKIENGELVLCLTVFGKKKRPTKFESAYGQPYAVLTFKKEK